MIRSTLGGCVVTITVAGLLTAPACVDSLDPSTDASPTTQHAHLSDEGASAEVIAGVRDRMIAVPGEGPATAAAMAEADRFRAEVIGAVDAHGWRSEAEGVADGYVSRFADTHFVNREAVFDGRTFDADRPEFLVYRDHVLDSVMFFAATPGLEQPPPPGAPLITWHYHEFSREVCLEGGMYPLDFDPPPCSAGSSPSLTTPLMLHISLAGAEHDHDNMG